MSRVDQDSVSCPSGNTPSNRHRGRRVRRTLGWLGAIGGLILLPLGRASATEIDVSQPFTLPQLIELATERNLGYLQSVEGIDSASASLKSSRSVFYPSARASASYGRQVSQFDEIRVVDGVPQPANLTNVDIQSSLVFSGGLNLIDPGSWYQVREAGQSLSATRLSVDRVKQNLAYSMTQFYYEFARSQELVQVSKEAYDLASEQLRRAESLYELGSVARSDVLQAQVNLASAERDRISTENAVETNRARLALAIGVPVSSPVEIVPPEPPVEVRPDDEAAIVDDALQSRPDIRQAVVTADARESAVTASEWGRWPTLGASYSFSKRGTHIDEVFQDLNRNISYGGTLNLNWTLFDGFNQKGAIQRAKSSARQQELLLDELKLQVALDVREAMIGIKNASEAIRSAREGVRLADESVRLQQALYESGGGTLLEWNNAQVELTRARVSLIEAEVDLHLATAGLDRARGRTP